MFQLLVSETGFAAASVIGLGFALLVATARQIRRHPWLLFVVLAIVLAVRGLA